MKKSYMFSFLGAVLALLILVNILPSISLESFFTLVSEAALAIFEVILVSVASIGFGLMILVAIKSHKRGELFN